MKILLILFGWVGKGTYWRALRFGEQLARRGHSVTLMVTSRDRRSGIQQHHKNGITFVEMPDLFKGSLRSGWDAWNILNRIHWLRNQTFDLVHAFETRPTSLFPALYLKNQKQIPLILDWCDWFGRGGSVEERPNPLIRNSLRPVETFFEERFRNRADGTTVINSVLRQKALELGVPPESMFMLPNGADIEGVKPQSRTKIRQVMGFPLDVKILAYTGAIFWRDAQLMAAAFNQIHHRQPDTRLLLIGYFNINIEPLLENPAALIQIGSVNYTQLTDYIAAADIGWLPLRNSGANRGRFPMKLHDFMAAGRPVVVTDVGDLGKLVKRTSIGRVAMDTPDHLAHETLNLLNNPLERQAMERRARNLAETEFSWPKLTAGLERFYHQVLQEKPSYSIKYDKIERGETSAVN